MIKIDLDKISKNELATILVEKDKEIERLQSIIKEVREYATGDLRLYDNESIEFKISNKLLEILDKENN